MEFTRKERDHLDVLERRQEHLTGDHPERSGDPAYPPGEANALAWALSVLRGSTEPIELRVERLEQANRRFNSRLGRIEDALREEDDEL